MCKRTLNKTESKYAQIDKEWLVIILGKTEFQQIVGCKFITCMDHKPLTYHFGEKKGILMTACANVTRGAVQVSGDEYVVQ